MKNPQPVKSLIPYDMDRGGQVIEKLDLTFVNQNRKNKLHNYATAKMEDIKKQYDDTIALWEWNNYVDSFNIGFDPVVGKTYYLYEGTTKFVSILSPKEFKRECVGITKLTSDGYWEKISCK
jgi:hypothetical protein